MRSRTMTRWILCCAVLMPLHSVIQAVFFSVWCNYNFKFCSVPKKPADECVVNRVKYSERSFLLKTWDVDMMNATASLLDEPVGSMRASDLFISVMANSTTLTNNVSTLVSKLPSTERHVTEFPDITSYSSLGNDSGSYFDNTDSSNCTNDYCMSDADYISLMADHIFPTTYEWVMIALHAVVFVVGLVGNALVCVAVYRNHSMRTVTNYFIVNLAVADFMVIFFCLPPTVVWDVTETWFLGTALCKVVVYFQVGKFGLTYHPIFHHTVYYSCKFFKRCFFFMPLIRLCRDLNWEACCCCCCFPDEEDEMAGACGMHRIKGRLIQKFDRES